MTMSENQSIAYNKSILLKYISAFHAKYVKI